MRRLPVYFLIDVSESMVGEPIEYVQDGMRAMLSELKTDPVALETVWISIIGFAGKSSVITSLQDVITFYPPKFPIGSGTSLSSGLTELMRAMNSELVPTTYDQKGDWKPIVFLFTDGVPTDDPVATIAKWQANYSKKVNLIAISLGNHTNYELLGQLTTNILHVQDTRAPAFKEFFRWVTVSIKTTSEGIAHRTSDALRLEIVNPHIMEKVDLVKNYQVVDENFVVLHAKCSITEKSYLIKFKKEIEASGVMNLSTRIYRAQGAYKIEEKAYQKYSDVRNQHLKISTQELFGNPICPCCGNQFSLASCVCGKIHCVKGVGENNCPWCGRVDLYGASDGGFNITRTLG